MAAVLIVAAVVGIGLWSNVLSVSAGRCQTDDELPASERDPYEQTALRFARYVVTSDADEAYGEFTNELKQVVPLEQLRATVQPIAQMFRTLSSLRIAHTYTLKSAASGSNHWSVCTAVAHGSLSSPEGKVLVAEKSIPLQAHVIVEGETNNNTWAFVVWLIPEPTVWRILSFHIMLTASIGKSASEIWAMAREQRSRGHHFNAAILYAGANELAYRGSNFQLGIWPEIQKEAKELQLPKELQGQPPFTWQFGMTSFRVQRVGPLGVGGKMTLMIRREAASLDDTKQVDDENHVLIREFAKSLPEYADVFQAIVIEAVDPTGRGFRTVEDVGKTP